MFPVTFIEVGRTLSRYIINTTEATAATALLSLKSSTLQTLTHQQQQEQQQQQPRQELTTTDIMWKNSAFIENVTQLSLPGAISSSSSSGSGSSSSGSGAGFSSLDVFEPNSSFGYVPPMQRPETLFITILFLAIFVVGVLGNGTLVIIFFNHRSMRNIPNTYILSLASADLLVIIVCVPLAILVYTTDSWTFGKSMCQITEFFKDVSIGVSVFTLTALSGERYYAIVNPLRKLQTKPLTVIIATGIWVLSIILAFPSLIMSDLQHILIDEKTNLTIIICTPFGQQRNNSEIYARYVVGEKAVVYYLLPLFIIGVLYMMMARRLHVSAREMPGETFGVQSRMQMRARRYVARMVVAFVAVFFLCFFPYHLFELWFHWNPTAREDFDDVWHAIRIIGFCTYFLNSCLNPVALYCVSGVFRAHFNRYLFCSCFKRPTPQRHLSTATGTMDTSIANMSVRSNYNRASVHCNSAHCTGRGGGGGGGGSCNNNNISNGFGRAYSHHHHHHHHHHSYRRHSIMQHQHNGSNVVVAGGIDNGHISPATGMAQTSVILDDKR